jgi:V-type H+-transporting ATPase subunit D
VIPRLEGTVKYIISELDEMDREEFFRFVCDLDHRKLYSIPCRLKKVQGKKKRDAEKAEAAKRIAADADGEAGDEVKREETPSTAEQAGNLLNAKDEDVIF